VEFCSAGRKNTDFFKEFLEKLLNYIGDEKVTASFAYAEAAMQASNHPLIHHGYSNIGLHCGRQRTDKYNCHSEQRTPVLNRDFSLCAIIKYCNSLCALEKIQRSSAPLLQLFRVIHATSVSLGSNAVKLQV